MTCSPIKQDSTQVGLERGWIARGGKTPSRCDLTTMDPRTLAELRQSGCKLLKRWLANQRLFAREARRRRGPS